MERSKWQLDGSSKDRCRLRRELRNTARMLTILLKKTSSFRTSPAAGARSCDSGSPTTDRIGPDLLRLASSRSASRS